jgi:Mn-containing catalase
MQGRLQVARLFHMTDDPGVKDMLRFLITRDHWHQMLWLQAIQELESDGLDKVPVPDAFDIGEEYEEFARLYVHASDGESALQGRWSSGPAFDGGGDITVQSPPEATGDRPTLPPGDPRLYGTPPTDPGTLLSKLKDAVT